MIFCNCLSSIHDELVSSFIQPVLPSCFTVLSHLMHKNKIKWSLKNNFRICTYRYVCYKKQLGYFDLVLILFLLITSKFTLSFLLNGIRLNGNTLLPTYWTPPSTGQHESVNREIRAKIYIINTKFNSKAVILLLKKNEILVLPFEVWCGHFSWQSTWTFWSLTPLLSSPWKNYLIIIQLSSVFDKKLALL